MECMVEDCNNVATKQAELVIITSKDRPASIGTMDLKVCNDCATEDNAKTLINPVGCKQIEDVFQADGFPKPDWNLSYARWKDRD